MVCDARRASAEHVAEVAAVPQAGVVGELVYGSGTSYELDDRTLAHIKVAVGAKLRRQESFYLSWVEPEGSETGRVSLWVAPSIPLQIHFLGNTAATINATWIRALELSSVGDRGMVVIPEADADAYVRSRPVGPV